MINDLKDASTQLQDGSKTLAEGTDTLADGLSTLQSPIYAKFGKMTGEQKYYDKMWDMYSYTRNVHGEAGMYNPKDCLWWRDQDFDPPYKEPNGEDCYWSRGNGCVYAALVRVCLLYTSIIPGISHLQSITTGSCPHLSLAIFSDCINIGMKILIRHFRLKICVKGIKSAFTRTYPNIAIRHLGQHTDGIRTVEQFTGLGIDAGSSFIQH